MEFLSASNKKIKRILSLQRSAKDRREENVFIAEGVKMYFEAPGELLTEVYLTEDALAEVGTPQVPYYLVEPAVFARISDTQTPQGVLSVLKRPGHTLERIIEGRYEGCRASKASEDSGASRDLKASEVSRASEDLKASKDSRNSRASEDFKASEESKASEDLKASKDSRNSRASEDFKASEESKASEDLKTSKAPLILVLENLQDPGNLGTILRVGEAAGVTGIIMSKGTVDIYNPKVVRSTMGSIYRMPFVTVPDIIDTVRKIKDSGIVTYAAHLQGSEIYTDYDYTCGTAFFIGNEGNGLSDEITALADKKLFIPMEGSVESLNAGIAAAVLTYEAHRQRH